MVLSFFQRTALYQFGVPQDAKVGLTDMTGPSVLVPIFAPWLSEHGPQRLRFERGQPKSELI